MDSYAGTKEHWHGHRWSCWSAQVRYQFAVMRSFIVTFHKSQTVLRTGVIGNILLKRYTLKPGLAFPQNLASSETLAWHFWLGLRFGLFKNVGLKFKKKGSLHIVSDFFHRIFIAFIGYWKLNAFLTPINTDEAEISLPSRDLISASSAGTWCHHQNKGYQCCKLNKEDG